MIYNFLRFLLFFINSIMLFILYIGWFRQNTNHEIPLFILITIILYKFNKQFLFYITMFSLILTLISQTVDYNWFVEQGIKNFFKQQTWVCHLYSTMVDDAIENHTSVYVTFFGLGYMTIVVLLGLKFFYGLTISYKPIQKQHHQIFFSSIFIFILFYFHYECVINYIVPAPTVKDLFKYLTPQQKKYYDELKRIDYT